MIVSVPVSALGEEPETGASTNAIPRSASAAPMRRTSAGAIVEQSMNSVPGAAPSTAPSSPSSTSSTCGAVDHHRDHGRRAVRGVARRGRDAPAVLGDPRLGLRGGAVVRR